MVVDLSCLTTSYTTTDSVIQKEISQEKQKIEAFVLKHEQKSHRFPLDVKDAYMLKVKMAAQELGKELDLLSRKGATGQKLREVTDSALNRLETSMQIFLQEKNNALRIQEATLTAFHTIHQNLQQLSIAPPTLTTFQVGSASIWKKTLGDSSRKVRPSSTSTSTSSSTSKATAAVPTHAAIVSKPFSSSVPQIASKEENASACTPEERNKLQGKLLAAYAGGYGILAPTYREGPCKKEYDRIAIGAAMLKSDIPFAAASKMEQAVVNYFVGEVKNFCSKSSCRRRFCSKSADFFKKVYDWSEAQRSQKAKEFFQKIHQAVEKAADTFEELYFVPKETTKEAIKGWHIGLHIVAEQAICANLFKKAALKPKLFTHPRSVMYPDWEHTFISSLFTDIGRKSQMMLGQRNILRLQGMKLPLMLPAPKQTLLLTGRTVKDQLKLLPAPLENQRVYRLYRRNIKKSLIVSSENLPKYQDVYFHATSLRNASSILKDGKVKRFDASGAGFQGAFLGSIPEVRFKDVVFALNRNVEMTGEVINAEFFKNNAIHWVGFKEAIPVTKDTLEYVAVSERLLRHRSIEDYAKFFSAIAEREVLVRPIKPIVKLSKNRAKHEGTFVPEHWPQTLDLETDSADLQRWVWKVISDSYQ